MCPALSSQIFSVIFSDTVTQWQRVTGSPVMTQYWILVFKYITTSVNYLHRSDRMLIIFFSCIEHSRTQLTSLGRAECMSVRQYGVCSPFVSHILKIKHLSQSLCQHIHFNMKSFNNCLLSTPPFPLFSRFSTHLI